MGFSDLKTWPPLVRNYEKLSFCFPAVILKQILQKKSTEHVAFSNIEVNFLNSKPCSCSEFFGNHVRWTELALNNLSLTVNSKF